MSYGAVCTIWATMAGAVAVNVFWQGALIGGIAALGLYAARNRSPHTRYGLACVGLVAVALLVPLNGYVVWMATEAAPSPVGTARLDELAPGERLAQLGSLPEWPEEQRATLESPARLESVAPDGILSIRESRPRAGVRAWYDIALPWFGRGWFLGLVLLAFYDIIGLHATHKMRRAAAPATSEIMQRAAKIQARLGVRTRVWVGVTDGLSSAFVTGFFRVSILLPGSALSGLSPEALEAILAHEFAHIRRWDSWVNGLQRLVEALLFFHPVVWWLSKTIRAERELCCDEIVLASGTDRSIYARALLTLAESAQITPTLALSSTDGNLAHRIRRMLVVSARTTAPPAMPPRRCGNRAQYGRTSTYPCSI